MANIFDEITVPAKSRNVFDSINIFDTIEAEPPYDSAPGDAQPQAAPYVIASPEQAKAATDAMTAVDVATAPYKLDTSDLTAERVMEAYLEKDKLEKEGIRWIGGFGPGGERPDTTRSFALKPGVKGTPELLERANRVREVLTEADKRELATPEWQAKQAGQAASAADIAVRESPMGNPNIFLERMGMNALPAAGALAGARMMTVQGAQGIQKLLPFLGAAVGGALTGATQEKIRQIGETPEDTASRQDAQATRSQSGQAKFADLASMGLLFGPSRNIAEVGVGAGVGAGFAGANAALEGRLPNAQEVGQGILTGAAFSGQPSRLARGILGTGEVAARPGVEARANLESALATSEPVDSMPSVSSNTPLRVRQAMRPLSPDEAMVVATEGIDALPSADQQVEINPTSEVVTSSKSTPVLETSAEPKRNLGPGAANIEEPLRTGGTVAAYNAAVDAQRAERGLPPLMSEARKADEVTWDNAEKRIEADPNYPDRLVADIIQGRKTSVTDEEQAALLWQRIDLRNKTAQAYERLADESLTPEERVEAESNAAFAEQLLSENDIANRKAGTASGRALRSRRLEAEEDFTLAAMTGKARTAKGEPLTETERAEITQQQEKIAAAEKGIPEREAAVEEAASVDAAFEAVRQEAAPTYSERFLKWAQSKVAEFDLEAQQAHRDLRALMGFASANPIQPKAIAALYKIARAKIARVGFDLTKFTAETLSNYGEAVRPFIKPAWDKAMRFFEVNTGQKPPSKKQLAKQAVAAEEAVSTEDGIKAIVAGGETKLDALAPYVKKLAKDYIKSGTNTVEGLEARLHEFFVPLVPEVTPRQLRDIFSDYGKSKAAPTDPIKITQAQLRSEAQKLSALEALLKKEAPLRTGQQRVPPSTRDRNLQKQINELKKELGIVDGDPATRLRSTLESLETRTRNRIKDLRFEIAKGERTIKQKGEQPTSPQLDALRAELKTVQTEHEAVFGKREATPEQRLKAALKAAERSEADANAELADAKKGVFKSKAPGKPVAPEVAAIRARAEAAREETKTLRMLTAEGKADAQKVAVQAYKTRQKGRAADYAERIAKGDFEQRKRVPLDVSKDPEAVRLKAEADAAKAEFEKKQSEWEQAKRNKFKKFADTAMDVLGATRSLKTSMDVSAPLRQGGIFGLGDLVFKPARFFRQMGNMFRSFGSKKKFDEVQAAILLRPNADLYKEAGLSLTDLGTGMTAREENMRSTMAELVPGVKGSNRAYTAFLNQQRAEAFDAFVDMVGGRDAVTPEQAKFFAEAVNDMTGRGSLPKSWIGAANAMAKFLFSPRFLLSRFNVLLGRPIFRGLLSGPAVGAKARLAVAAEYGKFAVGAAALLGLAKLAGAEINLDPKSTDFLKMKFGNTRIDVMTGLQQVGVFLSRMLTRKQTTTAGKDRPISGSTIGNFVRGKLAPIPGTAIDLTLEKNVVGEPVTPASAAWNMVSPLSFQPDQLKRLYEEQGPLKGSAIQLLQLMGAGVNTYKK